MTEAAKTEQEKALEAAELKAKETNEARSGKGTRVRVGQTRGRNPQVISYESFDESKPDTLPESLTEFMTLTNTSDEKAIVAFLVDGYNAAMYTAASDPIAEFVDASWPEDLQKQFRIVVRNYANAANVSLEDAVALIKPGMAAAAKA